jgi:ATP/maltotriose-dependent transcriptional regulator MalT
MNPSRIAELIENFLNGRSGLTIDEIVANARRWGDELNRLGTAAEETAWRIQSGKPVNRAAALRQVTELREALAPFHNAGPIAQDVLTIINWRYRTGEERVAAAERLLLLVNPRDRHPPALRRHDLIVAPLDAVAQSHEHGKRTPAAALRYGIDGQPFATWLRGQLRRNMTRYSRDEHPHARSEDDEESDEPRARRDQRPADSTTPEDTGLLGAAVSPRERELLELLKDGASRDQAACKMRLSEKAVQKLFERLRSRE